MGKTLSQVDSQVRELVGDYQLTTFQPEAVAEAVNWAQNLVLRVKGFKYASRLYVAGVYPIGALPSDWLSVKRMLLVTTTMNPVVTATDTSDALDTVVRVLRESSMEFEDSVSDTWRSARAHFLPRRWTLVGDMNFATVPALMPTDGSGAGLYVRLHYNKMATPVVNPTDPIDSSIPDYYQEALRYAAVAYLIEKDTDLKSVQLKGEMMKSFDFHMSGGVPKLAVGEQDS